MLRKPHLRKFSSFVQVFLSIVLFVLVASLLGCGGGNTEFVPPLVPVKGMITVDGAPVTAGHVSFVPLVTPTKPTAASSGKIGSDGTYEIFTGGKSGAPTGKFKVWLAPSMVPPKEGEPNVVYDSKYTNAGKTPLEIEVVDKAAAGSYDLKLSK